MIRRQWQQQEKRRQRNRLAESAVRVTGKIRKKCVCLCYKASSVVVLLCAKVGLPMLLLFWHSFH